MIDRFVVWVVLRRVWKQYSWDQKMRLMKELGCDDYQIMYWSHNPWFMLPRSLKKQMISSWAEDIRKVMKL